jgi:ANTAR domain
MQSTTHQISHAHARDSQWEPRELSRPLPRSLQSLAQIALQKAGADGYAIYQLDPRTDVRELKFAAGSSVPQSHVDGFTVTSFPLHAGDEATGVLSFVFRGTSVSAGAQSVLTRIAGAIEDVWRLSLVPQTYARNAARIGELEAELADAKIADRADGLLAAGQPPADAIDTIARHVESVLRPGQLATVLGQLIVEVQQEIAERDLANRAKALLQSRYGMSEDQAHVHLRLVSRKSRKRLRDVARDLLEESVVQNGR